MRSRSYLFILAAMLLVLPATGIVNAEEAEEPAVTEQVSETSDTNVEQVADEAMTLDEPLTCEPQGAAGNFEPEVYTNKCGQCSVHSICRGVTRGTPCGFGKWCIPVDTMFCPGTDDWDCKCASHYN
jgi:hypothetical protein